MKIASISRADGSTQWGLSDGQSFLAPASAGVDLPLDLVSAIQVSDWREQLRPALRQLHDGGGQWIRADQLAAPLVLGRNVFCLGPNYSDHAAESAHSPGVPAEPVYFSKATTTLAPPVHSLPLDRSLTTRLDWEVELAVVIAVGGRNIDEATALDHVLGYSVAIDFSARDVQEGRPEGQWFLGKSIDGYFPLGPWIVTTDEIPDPQALRIELTVNGVVKQHATTEAMLFPVRRIIADLSRYVTLQPGDVISTGTPGGVGNARDPQEHLAEGDRVVATISGIGSVTTTIVPTSGRSATTPGAS
ncbi:fumarylacetoacetate hydrolase family protein [Occultella gossypii]|uniref:Fumarylacetoacetate hydrolase family protein n=1 Tax=Occultella gossypii TaxID=2800820 RepID=A0ABS7S435_9MICO|nr:fumarylacetoacetate hydrolase family protein [Occultella gossypii]MBZ2194668.1 fumarylacetoacetate hydrolase family protein [Occultella gossypii]